LVALALVLAAEAGARLLGAKPEAAYGSPDAMLKWTYYRAAKAAGRPPDLLIIGDSTAAREVDPARLLDCLPSGLTAYNLGHDANFPLALRVSTLPLLATGAVPRVVVASLSPTTLCFDNQPTAAEAALLRWPAFRQLSGDLGIADHLGLRLLLPVLRARVFAREAESHMTRLGFQPLEVDPHGPIGPDAGRQRGSVNPVRVAVVTDLGELARQRGFRLAVIVAPLPTQNSRAGAILCTAALRAAGDRLGFMVIDGAELATFEAPDYESGAHLLRPAAERYSRLLGRRLAAEPRIRAALATH